MNNTLGLVITFNPSPQFYSNLKTLFEQLERVLVVDNGSDHEVRRLLRQEVADRGSSLQIIFNDENLGIATALNQGFRWALAQGYGHVISFDQDSQPDLGMVSELKSVYDTHPNRDDLAMVVPNIIDPVADIRSLYLRPRGKFIFERVPCSGDVLDNVSIIKTSGSFNNLAIYQKLGPFRDDFFIDYVDTEYCLRALQYGYKIAVACNATLHHRLGDQKKRQIGSLTLRPTFHSPLRWYYVNRNRIAMFRLYAFKVPYWAIYDVLVGVYAFLKMLFYEDRKLMKILAVLLGMWDGLLHRMGPISQHRKMQITSDE